MEKAIYIQGIFSTSISKLLLDNGFELAYPSKTIIKRLNLEKTSENWRAAIISNLELFGIKIFGEKEIVNKVLEIFSNEFKSIVIKKSKVNIGSTYVGEVVENEEKRSKVYVKDFEGYIQGKIPIGTKLFVASKNPVYKEEINLWNGICIPGKYMILAQNSEVKIPYTLKFTKKGNFLRKLTEMFLPIGWGVEFLETCINVSEKTIQEEFLNLIKEKDKILKIKPENIGEIIKGHSFCEIHFSYEAKQVLDKIRNKVLPTINEHHYLRTFGKNANLMINFAEDLLLKNFNKNEVYKSLLKTLFQEIFKVGKKMKIEHYKVEGNLITLSPGVIIETDPEKKKIILMRKFTKEGFYDGIEAKKIKNDYCITTYQLGAIASKSYYYRKDGNLIGIYINISTPIEFYEESIRYIDLGVDLVKTEKGEIKIIDIEEFKRIYDEGFITDNLYKRILTNLEKEKEILEKENVQGTENQSV